MKIAVLSDSHDNIWMLDAAMPHLKRAEAVIHCGDLCSPFMARFLGDRLGGIPLHIVWGNNDGDRLLMAQVASQFSNISLHGQLAVLTLGGLMVAVNHYPEIARGLALSGQYQCVCYGHDHEARAEWIGGCLLLDPGELMGLKGRSTLVLLDSGSREVEWVDLHSGATEEVAG